MIDVIFVCVGVGSDSGSGAAMSGTGRRGGRRRVEEARIGAAESTLDHLLGGSGAATVGLGLDAAGQRRGDGVGGGGGLTRGRGQSGFALGEKTGRGRGGGADGAAYMTG